LPASRGDDPPKDKDPKKDLSAREQYSALVTEFSTKQRDLVAEYRKAKGEEQQKILKQYRALGGEFADRFLKLAEANPKDPVAVDAALWIVGNAGGGPAHEKAVAKLTAFVNDAPLAELKAKLERTRVGDPAVLAAVLKRAEKDEKDPASGDLVAWVARSGAYEAVGPKAVRRLVEKYPDHPALEQIIPMIAEMEGGDAILKDILAKSPKPKLKAAATLGLGKALAEKVDTLGDKPAEAEKTAAEAEKYLAEAVDLYKDSAEQKKEAEGELKAIRTLRVGKEAPDIKAGDLDGKDFKLSDYRGKVVLLDFWGNW